MGFAEVKSVRQGKVIELDLEDADKIAVQIRVEDMCQKLLANSVIESFQVEEI